MMFTGVVTRVGMGGTVVGNPDRMARWNTRCGIHCSRLNARSRYI